MTTYTPRHTARPSRSRVARARLGAWCDRHDDAITLSAVALVVAIVSALLALALATDYDMRAHHALAVAVLAVALSALSGFFGYMVGSDRASRRVSRRYSRYLNEQRDKHERAMSLTIGTRSVNEMSAYEMSAELARLATRDTHLRNALRVKVRA